MEKRKFAVVILGRDENLGMMFVAGEIREAGHEFRYFDGETEGFIEEIVNWDPDYLCFSPLCIDEKYTLRICGELKKRIPNARSLFGGPHIQALDTVGKELKKYTEHPDVDYLIIGPVRGTISKILTEPPGSIIRSIPTTPDDMPFPAREEFYESIPRLAKYYAKSMISLFGCPYNCTFCSNYVKRTAFGPKVFKDYYLTRRPIDDLIKEGKIIKKYNTLEIDWEDDDILFGSDIDTWLPEFVDRWKKEVGIPIRFMTSPNTVVSVSDELLLKLREISCWAIMGVQCGRPESLKLFNRTWQKEDSAKAAHDRLKSFGFSILMQAIVGLPVDDPVEDAIQTVLALTRIGKGSFANAFPLLLYPGTKLYYECKDKGLPVNEDALKNLHHGIPSIQFEDDVVRKIRNISKLVKIFVKYGVEEEWVRSLVEIDKLGDDSLKRLASAGYGDCVNARWNGNREVREKIFSSIGSDYLQY